MGIFDTVRADPLDDIIDNYIAESSDVVQDIIGPTPDPATFPGLDAYIRERGYNPANIRRDITPEQLAELETAAKTDWGAPDPSFVSPMAKVVQTWTDREKISGLYPFDKKVEEVLDDQWKRAEEAGVNFEGAPRSLQRVLWHTPTTQDTPRAMSKLLGEYYSDAYDDPNWLIHDFKVQREPHTDRLMYENPETGQATFYWTPGVQKEDVGMEAPKILGMIAASLAATAVTKGAGGWTPQILSDVVSYSAARYGELAVARKRGLLKTDVGGGLRDWTDDEIRTQLWKELLLVGGASASIPVALKLFTPIIGKLTQLSAFQPPKGLPFSMPEFSQAFNQVKTYFDNLGPKGIELFETMSAPQIMKAAVELENIRIVPASPMGKLASEADGVPYTPEVFPDTLLKQMDELKIQESGEVPKLLQLAEKKQAEVFERQKGELITTGGFPTATETILGTGPKARTELGEDIIQVAQDVVSKPLSEETAILAQIEKGEPIGTAQAFVKGSMEGGEAGTAVRGTLQKAMDKRLDVFDAEFANIANDLRFGKVVSVGPIQDLSRDMIKRIKSSVYPSVEKEIYGSWVTDPLTKVTKKGLPQKITNAQVNSSIDLVRKAKRAAMKSGDYNEYTALKEIEGAWKDLQENAIREQALKLGGEQGEILIKRINDNKAAYRQFINDFEEGLVGDLLKRVPGSTKQVGQYSLDDVAFIKRLLANSSEADSVVLRSVLKKPEYSDALDWIKGAIKQSYKDQMYTGQGYKPLTPAQHDAWLQTNRRNYERWFDDADRAAFKTADSAARAVEQRMLAQNEIIAGIKKTPWGKDIDVAVEKPSTIFKKTWGGDNYKQSQELHSILGKGGKAGEEATTGYKAQIMREMLKKTDNFSNSTKMLKYLDDNRDFLDLWYGKEFAKGYETIQKIVRVFEPKTGSLTGPGLANRSYLYKMATDFARVYVGLFTRPGRVLTAVSRFGLNARQNRVVRDLLNPQDLVNRYEATKWLTDPYVQSTLRALQTYNISEQRPVGEEEPTVPVARPLTQQETEAGVEYYNLGGEVYQAYNTGGGIKRSKLMPLRYDI
jgi:flagellar biosynthesis/type III secretory pathway protein FliH